MPYTANQVKSFPEKPRSSMGADEDGGPHYIHASEQVEKGGHEPTSFANRLDLDDNDSWCNSESGEGQNKPNKPEGRSVKPEVA